METLFSFTRGAILSASLFAAIGAQTAFVLRIGLQRRHVFATVLVCAICDAFLVICGVAGAGAIIERLPWLDDPPSASVPASSTLLIFGIIALGRAARSTGGLQVESGSQT